MKYGNFYRVFDDDCYIIGGLLGYKIYDDNKVGFAISEFEKVKKYQIITILVIYFIMYMKV